MHNFQAIKPEDIIEILLRRRWYIIIPFCLSMIVGICLVLFLPKLYQAETLVLLQAERVATNYVQPIINTNINTRIDTISQQILSRSNLEKIINEFKLLSGLKSENMLLEDTIEILRERITVDIKRSADYRRGIESFRISFKGQEPEKVMKVTDALAKHFINENLKMREKQTTTTTQIIDKELSAIKKRLKESEQFLKDFREKYAGGLPDQLESNLNKIDRLSGQLTSKQERLQYQKDRLNAVEIPEEGGEPETYDTLSLPQLVAQLKQLKNRYTDQHPDIIRLEKRIAGLENEAQTSQGNTRDMNIKREIKSLKTEITDLMEQISFYEDLISNTPKREQELTALINNFDSMRDTYNSFLTRKREAGFAATMEEKQQMEQFRILDFADLPKKPIEPDMVKLFLIVIAASLGIGGGLTFLLEYLDTSIRKP